MKTINIDGYSWNANWVASKSSFEDFAKTPAAKSAYKHIPQDAKEKLLKDVYGDCLKLTGKSEKPKPKKKVKTEGK
jgi:hypothetical protein